MTTSTFVSRQNRSLNGSSKYYMSPYGAYNIQTTNPVGTVNEWPFAYHMPTISFSIRIFFIKFTNHNLGNVTVSSTLSDGTTNLVSITKDLSGLSVGDAESFDLPGTYAADTRYYLTVQKDTSTNPIVGLFVYQTI